MAQVTVSINGRSYNVACGDGEEDQLIQLAATVDTRVKQLAGAVGQVGEARLLLMTALLLADDLHLAEQRTGDVEAKMADAQAARVLAENAATDIEARAVKAVAGAAEKLEAIAARLSGP